MQRWFGTEKMGCPNFQIHNFYGQLRHQIRLSNDSSIGRVFRSPLRWRWKMAALPLPATILDDLIPSFRFREWGHPRWRPEAEGPPFSTSTSMGIEKRAPSLGWRHIRRRHLESKMAAPQVTSGGRRNSREILRKGRPSLELLYSTVS